MFSFPGEFFDAPIDVLVYSGRRRGHGGRVPGTAIRRAAEGKVLAGA